MIYTFILYLGASFLIGGILFGIDQRYDEGFQFLVINIITASIIALAVPFWLKQRELPFLKKNAIDKMAMVVIIGIIAVLAINTCTNSIAEIFLQKRIDEDIVNNLGYNNFWLQFFGLALALAISEELIYRGVLFSAARTKLNFVFAAAISSFIFGLAHGINMIGLTMFFVGFLWCFIYEKTKTIITTICIHFINNILVVLNVYLQGGSNALERIVDIEHRTLGNIIAIIVSIIIVVFSIMIK